MRRVLLVAGLLLAGGAALRAEDETRADAVRLELDALPARPFVHQDVRLRLRVVYDRAYVAAHAVPLFRQELDLPVQVDLSGWEALPGLVRLDPDAAAGARPVRIAMDGAVVPAARAPDETHDGRAWGVVVVEHRMRADAPGPVVVPAPRLVWVRATRFEDDFVGGRTALDPEPVEVRGPGPTIDVRPLPEAGRPEAFVDAVGRFTVDARLLAPEPDEDGVLRLRVAIEGEGNLAALTPPSPARLRGFHVFGVLDEVTAGRRDLTWDIAPLGSAVREIPAIPFAFLDPGPPPRYETVRTGAIALSRVAPPGAPPPPTAPPGEPSPAPPGEDGHGGRLALVLAAAAALLGVVAVLARRARGRRPVAPAPEAGPASPTPARPAGDAAEVLAERLASRLGVPPAAVITPDLARRLEAAGVPADLAVRAADALERLVASRYGAGPWPAGAATARAILAELDARERGTRGPR